MTTTPPTPPGPPRPSPDDEELAARLRRTLAEADPVPPHVVPMGQAAFGLRRLDEELAELVGDSLDAAAATRAGDPGGADERLLSFAAADMSIDIQVRHDADGVVTLLGEVDPPTTGAVAVDRLGVGGLEVPLVEGRFTATLEGTGPVRVRVVPVGGPSVSVSWFSV